MISYINISTHKKVVYVTSKLIIIVYKYAAKNESLQCFWQVESDETWKVQLRRQSQVALLIECDWLNKYYVCTYQYFLK